MLTRKTRVSLLLPLLGKLCLLRGICFWVLCLGGWTRRPPLLVYAVDKFDTLLSLPLSKSRSPKVLSDAITMYPTSTAEDLYRVLKHKGALGLGLITPCFCRNSRCCLTRRMTHHFEACSSRCLRRGFPHPG